MFRVVASFFLAAGLFGVSNLNAQESKPAAPIVISSTQSYSTVLVIGPRKDGGAAPGGVVPLGGFDVKRDGGRPVDPGEDERIRRPISVHVVGIPPESPSKATIYENNTRGALVVVGPK